MHEIGMFSACMLDVKSNYVFLVNSNENSMNQLITLINTQPVGAPVSAVAQGQVAALSNDSGVPSNSVSRASALLPESSDQVGQFATILSENVTQQSLPQDLLQLLKNMDSGKNADDILSMLKENGGMAGANFDILEEFLTQFLPKITPNSESVARAGGALVSNVVQPIESQNILSQAKNIEANLQDSIIAVHGKVTLSNGAGEGRFHINPLSQNSDVSNQPIQSLIARVPVSVENTPMSTSQLLTSSEKEVAGNKVVNDARAILNKMSNFISGEVAAQNSSSLVISQGASGVLGATSKDVAGENKIINLAKKVGLNAKSSIFAGNQVAQVSPSTLVSGNGNYALHEVRADSSAQGKTPSAIINSEGNFLQQIKINNGVSPKPFDVVQTQANTGVESIIQKAPDMVKVDSLLPQQPLVKTSLPVADQVSVKIATAIQNKDTSIKIQLEPARLGSIEVRIEIPHNGSAKIMVLADKGETLDLLQRDARGLERSLQDAGIKTDSGSLSFSLKGENGSQFAKEGRNTSGETGSAFAKNGNIEGEEVAEKSSMQRLYHSDKALDIMA